MPNVSPVNSRSRMKQFVYVFFAGFSGLMLASLDTPVYAGPKVHLGQKAYVRTRSMDAIDHSGYDALLQKYVDRRGEVNYTAWTASPGDLRALDNYLNHLSSVDPSTRSSRNAQLAYWINAYNAVTLKGILREYPTDSIRNHTAKLYGYNIWHDLLLYSGGNAYSLDTIEHKILRPAKEARIHFAIVCASRSCPKLLNRAYTPADLEAQLVQNTRDFFASERNFRFDRSANRIQLSSIMQWFAEDFGASKKEQLRKIAPYLPTDAAQRAASTGSASVSYLGYDWGLNDQKTAQ